jgi:hypothetical protein
MKPAWTRRKHSRIRKPGKPVHGPRLSILMTEVVDPGRQMTKRAARILRQADAHLLTPSDCEVKTLRLH